MNHAKENRHSPQEKASRANQTRAKAYRRQASRAANERIPHTTAASYHRPTHLWPA
jgi:hypothetical protein